MQPVKVLIFFSILLSSYQRRPIPPAAAHVRDRVAEPAVQQRS
jgi:hypothetical protein